MSDQSQNIESFRATALGKGWPTSVQVTGTEWSFQLDEPTEDGGTNSGANPMQYFAASLAGCQNEQAQVVAEELGVAVESIEIELAIDLDLSGFMGSSEHSDGSYKQVQISARVQGDLTGDQVQEMGRRVDARCPILGLLRTGGAEIVSQWSGA